MLPLVGLGIRRNTEQIGSVADAPSLHRKTFPDNPQFRTATEATEFSVRFVVASVIFSASCVDTSLNWPSQEKNGQRSLLSFPFEYSGASN